MRYLLLDSAVKLLVLWAGLGLVYAVWHVFAVTAPPSLRDPIAATVGVVPALAVLLVAVIRVRWPRRRSAQG